MIEVSEEEMARCEKLKAEDGVDEALHHWVVETLKRSVTLDQIKKEPDPLYTYITVRLNETVARKNVVTEKSTVINIEIGGDK